MTEFKDYLTSRSKVIEKLTAVLLEKEFPANYVTRVFIIVCFHNMLETKLYIYIQSG
jgi:hypothetical protein